MNYLYLQAGLQRRLAYGEHIRQRITGRSQNNIHVLDQHDIHVLDQHDIHVLDDYWQNFNYVSKLSVKQLVNNSKVRMSNNLQFCVICQGDIHIKDIERQLNCKHSFHVNCIERWLADHTKCPLCNYSMNT